LQGVRSVTLLLLKFLFKKINKNFKKIYLIFKLKDYFLYLFNEKEKKVKIEIY